MNDISETQNVTRNEAEISDWIASRIATELQITPEQIDRNQDLSTLGLDSIAVFTLTGDLAEWLDCDLRATLLWEYPSIQELSQHLAQSAD